MFKVLEALFLAALPSFIKVPYLRMRGAKIGEGATISILSILLVDELELGKHSRIWPATIIRCRKFRLGNRSEIRALTVLDTVDVRIGHDSIVMEQVVVGGMKSPRSALTIGDRVKIFPFCFINPTEPIVIEDEVGVGGSNYLFTHGSWPSALDGYPISFGPITIRKGVWLPWRVFILPNVEIGEHSTIGAGSVINRSIPSFALAAGSPAKVLAADGAYIKPKTVEQQLDYVDQIFTEMLELMAFEGAETNRRDSADGMDVEIRGKGTATRLGYRRNGVNGDEAADVVVSWTRIDEAAKRKFESRDTAWFDLAARECSLGKNRRSIDVRAFFGRFGVRFSVWGE
jgi:acetyltransferase-like isoleucine patch superfamily enzyme